VHVAVLDIGTNSIHMLVVRVDVDLKVHVLDRAKEMVRLGQGAFESGRLDEESQRRALEALRRFLRLAEKRGVERWIAVATSAVREAENGGAFLAEVLDATGIHPRVISGLEEARLVFKAVQAALPLDEAPILVVDLGGGSVEFAFGNSRQLAWAMSLKLGVQRLENLLLAEGEPVPEGRAEARERFARELAPVAKRVQAVRPSKVFVTSGSAGAVLKLLRARQEVGSNDAAMPRKALAALDDDLATMPRERRARLPGLEPGRVDLVVPAAAFFRALAETLDAPALHATDRALREGLLADFIERHGAELQWDLTEPNARRRAVLRFGERFRYDAPHAHHVANLAVRLFDGTRAVNGLDEDARELLEYGALLHDVGYAVSERGHHKHSEYLILNGLGGAFSGRETRMIAAIARYHRKAAPSRRHENWASLGAADRVTVAKAAALLRIADGLDRSHGRVVKDVTVEVGGDAVRIEVGANEPAELEVWGARRKADLFAQAFGLDAAIEQSAREASDAVA